MDENNRESTEYQENAGMRQHTDDGRNVGGQNGSSAGFNETLLEMTAGIIIFALLCQISIVWFVADKSGYSMGLWLGALTALLAAYHMWRTLDRALDDEESAPRAIQKSSILRYAVIVILLGIVMVTRICNPLSMFLGLMGLKVSAYLQPFTHKLMCGKKK